MKKLLALLLLANMFFNPTMGQDAGQFQLGLTNGKVINTDVLVYKQPAFSKRYFIIDGDQRFEFDQVKFYQNEKGYFLKADPTGYGASFYLRNLDGPRISTYSKTSTYYMGGGPDQVGSGFQSQTFDYYQKGNGRLNKMNLQNLNYDLKDNVLSAQKLKEVKKINTINALIYGAGAALLIGGIVATANSAKANESLPPSERDVSFSPLLFVGVVVLNVPWFTMGAKRKKMYEALELYNR